MKSRQNETDSSLNEEEWAAFVEHNEQIRLGNVKESKEVKDRRKADYEIFKKMFNNLF